VNYLLNAALELILLTCSQAPRRGAVQEVAVKTEPAEAFVGGAPEDT
jgi:hypothetical protein